MTFMFDAAQTRISRTSEVRDRKVATEEQWRKFDFGMDCLIPTEDYALPKDYDAQPRD